MLGQPTRSSSGKPKLAIVSTFDDLCGIAGYTRALVVQLRNDFDIEVFDLDQFFMRSTDRRVRKIANEMIQDFCSRVAEFDFVNIQLEHGTLGSHIRDIIRRFAMIARAAPALSVTFHTVPSQEKFGSVLNYFFDRMFQLKISAAFNSIIDFFAVRFMIVRMYRLMRRLQRVKPVVIIVHTRRDMRLMRYINRFHTVYHHPLAFLTLEAARALRATASHQRIPGLRALPPGAKVIGVFGFLSEYKGVHTAIQALHRLPFEYHLLIFGGLHPNEIKKGEKINAYIDDLLGEARVGVTALDGLGRQSIALQIDSSSQKLLTDHPKDIGHRVHFLGAQTDEGFAAGMAVCDHVVLPYAEVGQSSSGVLSMAVDMQCRVIAARNHAFMQFARYHPETIELFEIGNYLELAEKIMAEPAYPAASWSTRYDVASNTAMYVAAHSGRAATYEAPAPVTANKYLELLDS